MKTTLEQPPTSSPEKVAEPKLSQQPPWNSPSGLWRRKSTVIAVLSIIGIVSHLVLRFGFHSTAGTYQIPLLVTLAVGGLILFGPAGLILGPVALTVTMVLLEIWSDRAKVSGRNQSP